MESAIAALPPRPAVAVGGRRPETHPVVAWFLLVTVVVMTAGGMYHPPTTVVQPGPSFDVTADITITGVPTHRVSGRYLLATVRLSHPNAWRTIWSSLRSDREVEASSIDPPPGIAADVYNAWQKELFADSRQLAAAAAARANGYTAEMTGRGAVVLGFAGDTPASHVLRAGDVVVAADGVAVATASDLVLAVASQPAGTSVTLTVERAGQRIEVAAASSQDSDSASATPGLGAYLGTRDLRAVLPFQITFVDRPDIGGPSAGLAYALAISDLLDPTDDARARSIAATGTIDASGEVGPVAGINEKAVAARGAGASMLLVPSASLDDVDQATIMASGVADLDDALSLLAGV